MARSFIAALDEGTSSARFAIYDEEKKTVVHHQIEIISHNPHDGWVEQDPKHLLDTVNECIRIGVEKFIALGFKVSDIKGLGITNQRETTIMWDRTSGTHLHAAIVWSDDRTKEMVANYHATVPQSSIDGIRRKCGLPIHPYFSATKMRWLIENIAVVAEEVQTGRCIAGTVDTWIIWNLTGGSKDGKHVTDVTNASRTMLMDLKTLQWDDYLCKFFNVPKSILPEIRSSSEIYGHADGPLRGVPVSGILGDQHAALVGQGCFTQGSAKNTYGTGCFLLYNTGTHPVLSKHGLLTTVAFKFGPDATPYYALEGSVAVAGSAVRWLKDNLGIISKSSDVETLAREVSDSGGVYFVPAFSGLFAPHWNTTARGIIVGLTAGADKRHICRATLESVCFQAKEVLEAMTEDCRFHPTTLKVDGGMANNELMLQLQADMLGISVVRPRNLETTCLGAAIAAGAAKGIGVYHIDYKDNVETDSTTFMPRASIEGRDAHYTRWKWAVSRSLNWLKPVEAGKAKVAAGRSTGKWVVIASSLIGVTGVALYLYGEKLVKLADRYR